MNPRFLLKPKVGYAIPLILLCFFIVYPFLVDAELSYLVYFLYTTFIYVTLAQGWNLAAGYTGQVSLGQHAFVGIGVVGGDTTSHLFQQYGLARAWWGDDQPALPEADGGQQVDDAHGC